MVSPSARLTVGHTDVIRRAASLVEQLVIGIGIGIGVNPGKASMFSAGERVDMLEAEVGGIAKATGIKIAVVTFSGLAVDAARAHKATVIVRGRERRPPNATARCALKVS